ncbi:biotin/lipoyl-containing protein [Megasphaera sp.]|uniref:biotin/lipoyl-containing protein n=1 Tax=Megasphaera sp. TaxID=2023260 RepID=UPI0025FA1EF0|nr:biotin/lipoyl-containing protein [uncultured Megasphaera sp.]
MKKFRRLAVLAGLAGLLTMPAAAADVSYATVLSGNVVSVVPVGAAVKEGDVLLTVNSLAGPMPAARSDKEGTVKSVLVQPGSQVQQGAVVVVVETK